MTNQRSSATLTSFLISTVARIRVMQPVFAYYLGTGTGTASCTHLADTIFSSAAFLLRTQATVHSPWSVSKQRVSLIVDLQLAPTPPPNSLVKPRGLGT